MVLTLTPEDLAAIAVSVWDELLTGASHNIVSSAGRRLRQLTSNIVMTGTVVSATINSVVLDAGASAIDGAYDPALITIETGTGAGQTRMVYQYDGAARTCYVDRDWKVEPDNTSTYVILSDAGREHVNEGLARGGGDNYIILNTNASTFDDAYNGQVVFLKSGTGADQSFRVVDYDGASQKAYVSKNWYVNPSTDTAYVMLPIAVLDIYTLGNIIWSDAYSPVRTLTTGAQAYGATLANTSQPTVYLSDTMDLSIIGLGSLADLDKLYFTVKNDYLDTDAQSIIQIEKTAGLVYLNGASSTGTGGIVIDDASLGNVTISLDEASTSELTAGLYLYDIKIIRSAGITAQTLTQGQILFSNDVTKAVS